MFSLPGDVFRGAHAIGDNAAAIRPSVAGAPDASVTFAVSTKDSPTFNVLSTQRLQPERISHFFQKVDFVAAAIAP